MHSTPVGAIKGDITRSTAARATSLGQLELALARAWASMVRTPIVAVPALLAALGWTATLAFGGDLGDSPDHSVIVLFFILLATTACAVASTSAFAAAGEATSPAPARRIGAIIIVVMSMSLLGAIVAYAIRSLFVTWFTCAFFFMYAAPMVATGHGLFGSLLASARLAVRRFRTTLIGALVVEAALAVALGLGYLLSALPLVGTFLQSTVLHVFFCFLAVFALHLFRLVAGEATD